MLVATGFEQRLQLVQRGAEARLVLQTVEPHLRVHAVVRLLAVDLPSEPRDRGVVGLHELCQPLRVGLVQLEWHPDPHEHDDAIAGAIRTAAHEGARLVCLPELTRSAYFAVERRDPNHPQAEPEPLPDGPTYELVARCARETGTYVHASCYEAADDGGLGYNTAFVVAPDGAIVARTRKTHLPVTAGYHEDTLFRPGDSG